VEEKWWETRRARSWIVAPKGGAPARLLFDRSSEDRYGDPGHPVMQPDGRGGHVLRTLDEGRALLLEGDGASPQGDHPFIDKLDLASGRSERIWRCAEGVYEKPAAFVAGDTLLTSRQSKAEPPNLFLRSLPTGRLTQL